MRLALAIYETGITMRLGLAIYETGITCFNWFLALDAMRFNARIYAAYSPEEIASAQFHPIPIHIAWPLFLTALLPLFWWSAFRSAPHD